MANDTTETNLNWVIILITVLLTIVLSIIVSALVIKDKHSEYSRYYDEKIEYLQGQIDSLNVVINENKELPVFEVVIKNEAKETKKTINPRLKDTIVKPIIILK